MFCGQCGAKAENGSSFCGNCGNTLTNVAAAVNSKSETVLPTSAEQVILSIKGGAANAAAEIKEKIQSPGNAGGTNEPLAENEVARRNIDKYNGVASALKVIAWIIWGLGLIVAIAVAIIVSDDPYGTYRDVSGFLTFLVTLLVFIVSGLPIFAFGEVIQLLHNIDLNTHNADLSTKALVKASGNNSGQRGISESENPLIRRAFLFLEDGDWEKADDLLEQVLNQEPENVKAYVGKLCAELQVCYESDLPNFYSAIGDRSNYKKAIRFADEEYKKTLELFALSPENAEKRRQEEVESERKAQYLKLVARIDEARKRQDAGSLNYLLTELAKYHYYKNTSEILQKLTTPINNRCPLCNSVSGSGSSCLSCCLKLRRG